MRRSLARACVATIAAVAATVLPAVTSQADPVESGTLVLNGDPDDFVTGGNSYAFDVRGGDVFTVTSEGNATVTLWVADTNNRFWSVRFDAPGGETLNPGTTYTATGSTGGAELTLSGNGRGCNRSTGSFTVHDAVFGPYGYVEAFAATFEHRCEGADSAARGEVRITNPTPAPALSIDATTTSGTVDTATGEAVPAGTVSCSEPTRITLSGSVLQVQERYVLAEFSTSIACVPGSPMPWSASAMPYADREFRTGAAQVYLSGTAYDDTYSRTVTVESTTNVTLVTH